MINNDNNFKDQNEEGYKPSWNSKDSVSKAMITLYQIASSPLRKVYWIGLLFPFKNGCGGVICAKPRRTDL